MPVVERPLQEMTVTAANEARLAGAAYRRLTEQGAEYSWRAFPP